MLPNQVGQISQLRWCKFNDIPVKLIYRFVRCAIGGFAQCKRILYYAQRYQYIVHVTWLLTCTSESGCNSLKLP